MHPRAGASLGPGCILRVGVGQNASKAEKRLDCARLAGAMASQVTFDKCQAEGLIKWRLQICEFIALSKASGLLESGSELHAVQTLARGPEVWRLSAGEV